MGLDEEQKKIGAELYINNNVSYGKLAKLLDYSKSYTHKQISSVVEEMEKKKAKRLSGEESLQSDSDQDDILDEMPKEEGEDVDVGRKDKGDSEGNDYDSIALMVILLIIAVILLVTGV